MPTLMTSNLGPMYTGFWGDFLRRVNRRFPGWTRRSPTSKAFIYLPSGRGHCYYTVSFPEGDRFAVGFEILADDYATSNAAFDQLVKERDRIERKLGRVVWDEDTKRVRKAHRIQKRIKGSIYSC